MLVDARYGKGERYTKGKKNSELCGKEANEA